MKRDIFASDSTTLKLSLDGINWARHRRRKAAAKTPMRLNVGSMLPACAIVEEAAHHDAKRADALCAGMKDGDVLLADRAYIALSFGKEMEMTFITTISTGAPQHRRTLPRPLGHRYLLQGAQADAPTCRLRRIQ